MIDKYEFKVDEDQHPLRVDKYLMGVLKEVSSRNKIQSLIELGNIKVNDVVVKSNYKVKSNDMVKVTICSNPYETEVIPENIPLNIVYEDQCIIVVDKEPGMVVHPGNGNYNKTLINALLFHFDKLPVAQKDNHRPGLVHRIDKNTSGLLVIAKDESSMAHLTKQFYERTTERMYIALVWGDIEQDSGRITGNIGRDLKNRKIMRVFPEGDMGKKAITNYKVIERFGYTTLIECKLETGRTHQIRVHLKHIGHPIFNDDTYGGDKILKGTTYSKYEQFIRNCFKTMNRHALHAKTLGFEHPNNRHFIRFNSLIPPDFDALLKKWRNYSNRE
ncbi:RluA family pseudouridine synthase [Ichthyobacterium seriolicida]|uniref:Pseudouridine synthase n=1 Tax=Ichthyobacterium seriolicida TaxID=242600 RepID=A0A1J1EBU6_9FLAO|nr:RluA family pseudouridine synthase [Ichthyobacterium seriolicida]BAV95411.1 ribosomal large subunit pseudouridine synthase D [Ichthyobacterium seriolicida]